jgi:L-iditol 2-dehydrogenase
MVEPLACCLHGIERAGIRAGQTVAVVGIGPIGLMLCAAAKDAGANVVAVGGREERRELVPAFGGTPGDGQGADVVIEAAGTEDSWAEALDLVRAGGTVVFFGGLERGTDLAVDTYRLHYEELTLVGSFHHTPKTVRAALAFLASGAHPWERLVTHRVGLDEVSGLLDDPPDDLLKAAVIP